MHDSVSHEASDVRINLKGPLLQERCPAPEQLTNPRSIGGFWAPLDIGVTPVISSEAPYISTGANFAGQEIGIEIKF